MESAQEQKQHTNASDCNFQFQEQNSEDVFQKHAKGPDMDISLSKISGSLHFSMVEP